MMSIASRRKGFSAFLGATLGVAMTCGFSGQARAEAKEVRFADQPGLLYIPMYTVIHNKLVEKYAKQAGLGDIKVSGHRFSSGVASNDAMISGNIDFAIAGFGPLLKIWDRTKGTIDIKAMMAISEMPTKFITNDPRVKTPKDWDGLTDHKIGIPAIKTSSQAIFLQMQAEKLFGKGQHARFDPLTVSMPHPQAMAALFGGKSEIRTHGGTLPTQALELKAKDKGLRLVFSSYDVVGPHTLVLMYNTRKWKEANPKLFKAVYDAYMESFTMVNADLKRAAALYKELYQSSLELDEIVEMISDKNEVAYNPAPRNTMKLAEFMHSIGDLQTKPSSWKDYMWEISHGLNGS